MSELSDANLRAILTVILRRHGAVDISHAELYDAMMPTSGWDEAPFTVEQIAGGVRLTLREQPDGVQPA